MKKTNLILVLALSLAGALFVAGCLKENLSPAASGSEEAALLKAPESTDLPAGTPIEGKYIVVFKDKVIPEASLRAAKTYEERVALADQTANTVLRELNLERAVVTRAYGTAIRGFAVDMTAEQAQILAADPRIASVEQDQVVRIVGGPPGGGGGGGAQTTPWGITRVGGPVNYTGTHKAWIIDTGIDQDHPDLNVDVANSECFLSNCNDGPEDLNGHGTHVAGTIAAKNNTIGVVGVAANAQVVAVRVLDRRGSGTWTGVIAGVDYVAANASSGDVANLSLGGGVVTAVDQAVVELGQSGVKVSIAAGNESDDANNHSPARANGTNLYTVSAMAQGDIWAYYSNYGNPPVDYCAPGSSIYSCYKGGGYATMSGTSMAAPHVCGILLLGNVSTSGTVSGDPAPPADPIAHR